MSNHNKKNIIQSPIFIYASVAIGAALIAIIVAALLVNRVKNPPNPIINIQNPSSSNSSLSNQHSSHIDIISPSGEKPTIRGVENGKIYYTTQHINVVDDNLKSVTVNGDDYNANFFLEGNADNMYVIEAVDYDDNITTYIVYTKTIKSLSITINTINEYKVTANDLESIESVKEAVMTTGTRYSPPEETTELDNILIICEKLLNKINLVQEKVDKITDDYANPEHIESVKNNVAKLAAMITDIDELLASNNLTAQQRTQLTSIRAKYSSWLSAGSALEQLS